MFERKELFVPVASIHVAKQQVSSQELIHTVSAASRKREIIGCRWLKSVLARKIAGFAVWLINTAIHDPAAGFCFWVFFFFTTTAAHLCWPNSKKCSSTHRYAITYTHFCKSAADLQWGSHTRIQHIVVKWTSGVQNKFFKATRAWFFQLGPHTLP